MDLFQTTNTVDLAEQEARNLALKTKAGLDVIKQIAEDCFDTLWNNKNATPQQIFNKYGTNGYKLFENYRDIILFIKDKKRDPNYQEKVPTVSYIIKNDGSVEILDSEIE